MEGISMAKYKVSYVNRAGGVSSLSVEADDYSECDSFVIFRRKVLDSQQPPMARTTRLESMLALPIDSVVMIEHEAAKAEYAAPKVATE